MWSYSGDPSLSAKDEIRFTIGDTDSTDPLLQDEEIEFTITKEPTTALAAAKCCESIASKFLRLADFSLGPMHTMASQRHRAYAAMANRLRGQKSLAIPSAGGITTSDRDLDAPDGYDEPAFKRGMMEQDSNSDETEEV